MGDDGGVYNPAIVNPYGIQCSRNDGYVVWNAEAVGQQMCTAGRCESSRGVPWDGRVPLVLARVDTGAVVICAQPSSKKWKVAGINPNGTNYDPVPEVGAGSASAAAIKKSSGAPPFFWAATWTGVVGIAAHYFGYRQTHYLLMATTVVLATAGVALAHDQPWRSAKSSAHAVLGWIALAALWANATLGTLRSTARGWEAEQQRPWSYIKNNELLIGKVHRFVGLALIAVLAALTLSGTHFVKRYYAQYNADAAWASAAAYTAAASVLAAAVAMRMAHLYMHDTTKTETKSVSLL